MTPLLHDDPLADLKDIFSRSADVSVELGPAAHLYWMTIQIRRKWATLFKRPL